MAIQSREVFFQGILDETRQKQKELLKEQGDVPVRVLEQVDVVVNFISESLDFMYPDTVDVLDEEAVKVCVDILCGIVFNVVSQCANDHLIQAIFSVMQLNIHQVNVIKSMAGDIQKLKEHLGYE